MPDRSSALDRLRAAVDLGERSSSTGVVMFYIPIADLRLALDAIEAAQLVEAYHDAGGNEWWSAHDKLYAALAALTRESE
jgi:hypothetical protein